ncbi:hypothetical protein HPP92_003757 [Vanilla planifolia]|uniref:Cysteine-rich transmembrane domain-containing protein n=1 Tax=Vanilla planifolia TaxID=51239 RepID=A0A835VK43_VANPL|nr:hypothetical protein HPP92_004187 [Vanilla planifolia]KAG0503685.1 hypothetical protein HPP92_003757 [Vanilla planifolia]
MSYSQQQAPVQAYPPPQTAYPPPGAALDLGVTHAGVHPPAYAAPPPAGYPGAAPYAQPVPVKTKQRGDGFWKGCAAALCCCCVLETCCE